MTQEAEKFSLFSKAGEFEVLSSSPNFGLASFTKAKTVISPALLCDIL